MQPAPDGLSVFIGGYFSTVNGATHKRVARVYLSNGQNVPGFNANVTSGKRVMDMSIDGNTLYLGGQFSKIGTTNVVDFAALNADTGAVDPQVSFAFAGNQNGGPTRIQRMDISPDGSTIVAIGNFATVNGLDFRQIVKLNVGSRPATISDWQTNRYKSVCASKFDSYMRDVDIAPDGTYFVVATTGAYMGGPGAGVLCDTVTRWEMSATGSNQQPSWADYTGGDTTWSVLSTGEAIYVGGHMRWENNPFASDAQGPGAVPRVGTAALDPLNGLPLAWTATREPRREGVFKLLATSGGVWFGSDSCCISGERHERLAWMPIAGGTPVPAASVFHLPNELWKLPVNGCSSVDASILYRVNAAGGSIPSLDCGMDWQADDQTTNPLRNTGSNGASYAAIGSIDGTVPATTPSTIFSTERWDPNTAPEMSWSFPAPAGHHLQVRLYFGNQCTCTAAVGQRRFSVAIDGAPQLTNYDIVADVGNQRGTMKQFPITSDGTVNIDFTHVTENPLVNGIEIIDLDVPAGPAPGGATQIEHRAFDGTTAGRADDAVDADDRLGPGPWGVRDERPPVHRVVGRQAVRAFVRRHHGGSGHGGRPARPDLDALPAVERDRDVPGQRPPLLHGLRELELVLPVLHAEQRHGRSRDLHRQHVGRRLQLEHGRGPDGGRRAALRRPFERFARPDRVQRRQADRDDHHGERTRARRHQLEGPRPVPVRLGLGAAPGLGPAPRTARLTNHARSPVRVMPG